MASVNKVILVGNLGRDPELKDLASGMKICKFSIATSKKIKGEDKTQWHNITCFDKTAEVAGKYLVKGSSVFVEGEINYSTSEKDGVKKYFTDIVANSIQFLSKKEAGSAEPVVDMSEIPF